MLKEQLTLKNKKLHEFLCEKNKELTEQWFDTLDKSAVGVYASSNPETIEKLKQQNFEFHERFCHMFDRDDNECIKEFQDWILRVAKDEGHLATPLDAVLKEFFRTQKQYLQLIEEFAETQEERISSEQVNAWSKAVVDTINDIILEFTVQNTKAAESRLNAQQEMIIEMSAPVILLTKEFGLLPLVGEIHTYRAQIIFEKVLKQCHQNSIERLFIDLSGVPIVDTMVAHQIFQLIEGLKIIGVKTAIAGISPDIAQTAIQLGINFGDVKVFSKLEQAMKFNNLQVSHK
ncbi:STAS domain-containing protein [Planococcus shenhongbingii]|uniref:STAS domain-containing protein n=1 Tax=Planococcus shenhongbingii TaxID=3058398 RepID=A0ABT8NGL1_9BACL|nr:MULTISPECIES: STAS domain-containing protein [unclassified Planococcus (in: firmicutes)]MDN7246908.1 STAS domain-containing protein [Planococcus sp. N017]WKA60375.1 STAS domain-containing protein [Planococcus sp. N016]